MECQVKKVSFEYRTCQCDPTLLELMDGMAAEVHTEFDPPRLTEAASIFVLDTNAISELRHGKPQQSPEVCAWAGAMIAATAIEHRFTVVTRNTGDFVTTGVALVNPWLA